MSSKKVTKKGLEKIFELITENSDKAKGVYLFKDLKIQVGNAVPMSNAERARNFYRRRREQGLCIICGTKVKKKNPKTGKLYRLCEVHREEIDKNRRN